MLAYYISLTDNSENLINSEFFQKVSSNNFFSLKFPYAAQRHLEFARNSIQFKQYFNLT